MNPGLNPKEISRTDAEGIDNGRKGKNDNAIPAELNRKMGCGIKDTHLILCIAS